MANIFVRSTDGSDADNGSTWALAKATLAGASAIAVAGDTIYVSDNHSESTASAISFLNNSTVRLICVDDAGDPPSPTTTAVTAVVRTSGSSAMATSVGYIVGVILRNDSTTANGSITVRALTGEAQTVANCGFEINSTNTAPRLNIGSVAASGDQKISNSYVRFAHSSQCIVLSPGRCVWIGGSLAATSAIPNVLVATSSAAGSFAIAGWNLSTLNTAIFAASSLHAGYEAVVRNCRLHSSVSLISGAISRPGARCSMYNCDSGDTNYRVWIEDYAGTIRDETTLVKTGGAVDGTTAISLKMVSNALATEMIPLACDPIPIRLAAGVTKTISFDVLHDSVTALTDAEIWLECDYLGTSGYPQSLAISDQRASPVATPANQTTSTATWTTTGITNPNKQKLEVTITPVKDGFAEFRIMLGKASKTIYLDESATVT